ncbi:hypothetical protein GBG30_09785 [Salmonella enterica]|nr:hypothetical protein [Salmonella enterica]
MTNNKLPEWRKTLNKCVENYQSTRAWYEENRDSPAALDDMERAEDQLANFVKKCGFSIVLGLLDEIDELQELRRSCLALRGEIEDVQAQLYEAENRNKSDAAELQERRKADSAEPFGFVTKRCAEHMHDDDRDENNWMWSISAVVIGCNPKLKHEVPVYLHPASSSKEGA